MKHRQRPLGAFFRGSSSVLLCDRPIKQGETKSKNKKRYFGGGVVSHRYQQIPTSNSEQHTQQDTPSQHNNRVASEEGQAGEVEGVGLGVLFFNGGKVPHLEEGDGGPTRHHNRGPPSSVDGGPRLWWLADRYRPRTPSGEHPVGGELDKGGGRNVQLLCVCE